MSRATYTLLHFGADRTLRVDLNEPRGESHATVLPAWTGSAEALRQSLSVRRPGAKVLALHEALWTQTLEVPAAASSGLDDADIARMLAYELEPVSGIKVADSALGFVRVLQEDGERARFWVTQARAGLRASLEDAIRPFGARLLGLAHPCGIWATALDGGERRVEVFDGATCCASRGRVQVIAARAGQRAWTASLEPWLQAADGERDGERVLWRGRARPVAHAHLTSLEDQGAAPEHLDAQALLAATHERRVPLIASAPRPARRLSPTLLGALLSVAVALACGFELYADARAAGELEQRAARAESDREHWHQSRRALSVQEKKLAALLQESGGRARKLDAVEAEWYAQRERPGDLLRALGERKPAGIVLSKVEPQIGGGIEIAGLGVDSATINGFVVELGAALADSAWEIQPALIHEQITAGGVRVDEFTIVALPVTPAAPQVGSDRVAKGPGQ